jgi:diaminopropionate ammonia-lyase
VSSSDSLELLVNPKFGIPRETVLPTDGFDQAKAAIVSWPDYAPTPLHDLRDVAGPMVVRIKDEGSRFGLGSFKALGGAYAVSKLLSTELSRRGVAQAVSSIELAAGHYRDRTQQIIVTCATDGNHGRSVAWGAARFHCQCVIFVHETVSQGRIDAIASYGARVVRVPGNYDDSVRAADSEAKSNGWFIVSDTSYPGYTDIPRDVMQGYRLMADEAADQWTGPPPTHVFFQAGVGGAPAAVSIQMRERFSPPPLLIVVEPTRAACLLESAREGALSIVGGNLETIMAGLACGEPSLLAWQELELAAWAFVSIPDHAAVEALRLLAAAGIAIGESGVAGVAALRMAAARPAAREALRLGEDSRILLFGTEGITDIVTYNNVLNSRQS